MNKSILHAASNAHTVAQCSREQKAIALFKVLLKFEFGIEADPQALEIEVNGVRIRYLNRNEVSVLRKCPNVECTYTEWTDGMRNLEQLGRELATRKLTGHKCPKPPDSKKP